MADATMLAALAGLLHDIGKFAVRAGERGSLTLLDPLVKSSYGQYHALLTADFAEKRVPAAWREDVKRLAGNHHRPNTPAELAIQLADHLSAGERDDPDGGPDADRQKQPRQLLSIFSLLKADGLKAPGDQYWPLKPLTAEAEAAIFPVGALPTSATWPEYETLWRAFNADAKALMTAHEDDGDLPAYVESMLLLMQRYTTAMPSAYYYDRPDISLYDHSRMTGALAAVLAGWPDEQIQALVKADLRSSSTPVALLVGGDLSGIQDFIYTITSRGAASALRGRSFYLQLLTEAALRYTLRALDLPITNVVYVGGGKFYLLARAGDDVRLAGVQKQISGILLRHHRSDLYLALDSATLRASDFFEGRISAAWGEVSERLQHRRLRRFGELDPVVLRQQLLGPIGNGGNEDKQCAVCGQEDPRTQITGTTPGNPDGVRKCPQCMSFEGLGDALRRADLLSLTRIAVSAPDALRGRASEVLREFGLRAELGESNNPERLSRVSGDEQQVVYALSDSAISALKPASHTAIGRRFLTNVTPSFVEGEHEEYSANPAFRDELPGPDSVKPFDIMEDQAQGVKRLGVLMMDVDSLGVLFRDGLGPKGTLSRIAHLSFAINLFFEGWVANLARQIAVEDPGRRERLYSIYAGGDDLFFVGAWDAVVELAQRVRADLERYSGGHPAIHASGAIVLTRGKYPLYRAAQDLKEAERKAKDLIWTDDKGFEHKKDALCFLGQALPWSRVGYGASKPGAGSASAVRQLLIETQGTTGNTSLIRKMSDFYRQYAGENEKRLRHGLSKKLFGPWHYRMAYEFARLQRNDDVKEARDAIMADDIRGIEWIGMGARWAELTSRDAPDE